MSQLAEALTDLSAHGLLDRVTRIDLPDAKVDMLPKIAAERPAKRLPGQAEDEDPLFDAS